MTMEEEEMDGGTVEVTKAKDEDDDDEEEMDGGTVDVAKAKDDEEEEEEIDGGSVAAAAAPPARQSLAAPLPPAPHLGAPRCRAAPSPALR